MQIVKMVQTSKELPYMLKVSEAEALIIAKAVYKFPLDDKDHSKIVDEICENFKAWGLLE